MYYCLYNMSVTFANHLPLRRREGSEGRSHRTACETLVQKVMDFR